VGDRPAACRTAPAYTFHLEGAKISLECGIVHAPSAGFKRSRWRHREPPRQVANSLNYNPGMARGWESKSIEEQQQQATFPEPAAGRQLTPEQMAAEHRHRGLELSRKRVLQQLELVLKPQHRQMLEAALADLNSQLNQSHPR
jgi:hypothetical protein